MPSCSRNGLTRFNAFPCTTTGQCNVLQHFSKPILIFFAITCAMHRRVTIYAEWPRCNRYSMCKMRGERRVRIFVQIGDENVQSFFVRDAYFTGAARAVRKTHAWPRPEMTMRDCAPR